jgi:hypothetical protein
LSDPFDKGAPAIIANVNSIVHPLLDFNRQDQILTWGPTGLCAYASGATTPMFTLADIKDAPLAAAYVGDKWMVWTATQLYQIDSQGKVVWSYSVDHLPTMLVSAGGEAVVDDGGELSPDDVMNQQQNGRLIQVNGQLIRIQGNGGVVLNGRRGLALAGLARNGMAVVPVMPPAGPGQPGQAGQGGPSGQGANEQIVFVQPAGDQTLVATSTGRIISLTTRNGESVWQTRLIDRAVDQLLANPHFTVLRIDDPGGAQIAVYDTPTGRLIGKRRFGPENSQTQLVNVALSEEATLALTLYSRVVVKDLYDAWKPAPVELVAQTNRDAAPFVGMNGADQLAVKGGRLVCLYDSGSYARAYDLSKNADPTNPLATAATSSDVGFQMVGSRMFIRTSSRMLQYNLQDPTDHYEQDPGIVSFPPKVRQLLLGKDYAIVVNDSVDRGPAGSPYSVLVAYRRALIPGKTRERGDADYDVAEPSVRPSNIGITDWLSAEGGVYFLTKDGNLHLLRGARP